MRDASLISNEQELADFVTEILTAVLEFHYHHAGTRLHGYQLRDQTKRVLYTCLREHARGQDIHTVVDRLLGP